MKCTRNGNYVGKQEIFLFFKINSSKVIVLVEAKLTVYYGDYNMHSHKCRKSMKNDRGVCRGLLYKVFMKQ